MSPSYLPIYGITLPSYVNLHVPPLKTSKKVIRFVCLDHSWNDRRWSIASVLSGLFSGRVFIHSPSHEKMGGNRDAQSQTAKYKKEFISYIIKQKLPMESKPLLSAWWPPLACLAWKMLITDSREVNKKGACLKIIIYLCFKNWALAPLQITTSLCEGTFYLHLCCVTTF